MVNVTEATSIAVEVTPHILKALGAPKNLVKPIRKAIKSVDCKDQNALIKAINAQGPECAKISVRYVKMLHEAIQSREDQTRKDSRKQIDAKTALSVLGKSVGLAGSLMGGGMTYFMYKFTKAFSDALEEDPFGNDTKQG